MDTAFKLTQTNNLSLLNEWLVSTITAGYLAPARDRVDDFLSAQGRIAYTKRIFRELLRKDEAWAQKLYDRYISSFHPITAWEIDKVFKAHKEATAG